MKGFTQKGALSSSLLRWWGVPLLLMSAIAQTPSKPRVYSYHMLPADKDWAWKSIIVDPPLTLTRDASGQAHLGIDKGFSPAPGNCTLGGVNKDELSCKIFTSTDKSAPGSVTLLDPVSGNTIKVQVPSGLPQSYTITLPLTEPQPK